jgi:Icc-related predicted phosphoesterase
MELGKYKLAMRPKKYLTREFVVYKEAPEAMDDVITEEQNTIDTMPSQAPAMDNYMPEIPGMEDPSLRQVELADGGVVQREGFSQGSEALEKYSPEMYNKFLEISKKYEGTGVRIVPNIDKGNLFIRITTEPRYKDFRGKDIKLNYRVDKLGEEGLSQIEKNADAIVSNISPEYQKQRSLQVERMQTEAKKKSKTGLYGTREETVKQVNQIVKEVAEGKRPLFDLSKLSRGELLEGSEYKKTTDFLGYDYGKSKPRFLTKKNFKIYQNKIEPYLKSIRTTVSMNKNPIATEEFKNATIDTIEDLRIKYPSATPYDIPKNVGQHMMKSIERHVDKGGKKFTKISGDNISNYIFKETSTGKKFSADIVNKNPTNKKWKNYVDVYNNVKDINYNTQFIDKTTGELTTPAEAYRKLTNTSRGVPVEFEHFDELGVFGDPIKNVGISPVTANKAANIPGITEEQLQKGFGRMSNIDLEGNRDRTVKFLQKSLIKQKMNPDFEFEKPIDILENLNSSEKKVFFNFGNKVSMGLDPTDVLKMLPEKEYQIMKGAMSKVGNLTTMGVRGAQELLVGTGPVGLGITAALTVPFMVADLAEGKRFSEALQNQASALTFGFIPEADKRIIEEIGGSEAGVGFEIQKNIDKLKILQNDLREAEKRTSDDIMDPEAELAQSNFVENTRKSINKTFQDLLPYLNEQGQIIAPEYNAYLQASNKAEQERAYRKGIGDLQAYNVGFDDISISEEGPFQQDIDKLLKGKKQLEKSYSKILSADDLINQYAYGGRVGLEKGSDPKDKPIIPMNPMMDEGPQDPSKRTFIQGAGGVGLAGLLLGTGLLKLGKSATVSSKIGSMVKDTTAPSWMEALITKVMKEGKDLSKKEPGTYIDRSTYSTVSKDKILVKELEFKNPDTGKMEIIRLRADEPRDTIYVDYIGDNTLAGQGVTFKLSPKQKIVDKGNYLTSEKVKGEYQFSAHEAEPRVVNWDGDIEFDGETGVRTIIDLNSDISGLKSFVTGGKGVDKKVAKIKRETVDKIEKNPAEYIEDTYDANYYDPSLPD